MARDDEPHVRALSGVTCALEHQERSQGRGRCHKAGLEMNFTQNDDVAELGLQ
jgi:hypothetical protein